MKTTQMLTDAVRWALAQGIPVGVPTDMFGVTLVCSEFGRRWLRTDGPVDAAAAFLLQHNPPLRITTPDSMAHLQFYDALCAAMDVSPEEAVGMLWANETDVSVALERAESASVPT